MADRDRIKAFLAQPLLECEAESMPANIGGYAVREVLGEGGGGVVLRGEGPAGEVAIKLAHRPGEPLLEAVVLSKLNHPQISAFVEEGVLPDGRAYMVRHYVEGSSLRDVVFPDLASFSRCLEELLDILAYAHQQNVLHRDLKPENVVIDASYQPWLIDFGAAGAALRGTEDPHTVNAPLTPRYASPEQLHGKPATVASDIYAFGVILSEGLTRFPPSAWRFRLEQVAARCLAHDPSQRYESASQTRQAIRAAAPWPIARQRTAVACGALLIFALVLGGWRWVDQRNYERQRDELGLVMAGQWQAVENSTDVATSISALQSALGMLAGLERRRPEDPDVLRLRAQGLLRLAQLQGHPAFLNAGNQMGARRTYAEALQVSQRLAQLSADPCPAHSMVVEIALSLSSMRIDAGEVARAGAALAAARRSIEAMRRRGGCGDIGQRLEVYFMAQSSRFAFARQDWDECLRLRRNVLAHRQSFLAGQSGLEGFRIRLDLMEAHTSLGYALAAAGQAPAASKHYQIALAGLESLREQYPAAVLLANRLARNHRQMAAIQRQLQQETQAREHESRAVVIERMLVMPWQQAPAR